MRTKLKGISMQEHLVNCDNLIKIYKVDDLEVVALQGLELDVARGEMIALVGASGSGKTTLINILVGLDNPTSGQVTVLGREISKLNEAARAARRRDNMGLLFQNAHRFPSLTALESAELALRFQALQPAR